MSVKLCTQWNALAKGDLFQNSFMWSSPLLNFNASKTFDISKYKLVYFPAESHVKWSTPLSHLSVKHAARASSLAEQKGWKQQA